MSNIGQGASGTILQGAGTGVPTFSAASYPSSFTTGDIMYASNSTTVSKLAIGSAGQILSLSGGVPAWVTYTQIVNYVDACLVATTGALTASYNNGVAGVGAFLLNTGALAAFTVDGQTPAINSRVLVKNQGSTFQNGVYTLTTVGSGAVAWVLTRSLDYNMPSEIQPGDVIPVQTGTVNANTSWLQGATVTTIGTDPITFTQYQSAPISTTQYSVLVGGANNSIASVGPGTSGQILQSAGNASNPAYSTATYPATAGTTGNVLTSNGTNFTSSAPAAGGLGIYGDGSDGSQTFDGSTTILGIAPSGNTYTLSRDIFLTSSTINNGVTIIPFGFRIFCQGTLTNNGTIQWNGNNGTTGGNGGASISNSNGTISNNTIGVNGGNGNTGAGNGGNSNSSSFGGGGGNGGTGGSGGGTAGTATAPTTSLGVLRSLPYALYGFSIHPTSISVYTGGAGGGGGGGDGVNKGGGGGGGGAIVICSVKTFAGTGTISANGGNGGNGAVGGTNCGGGGGGGGGVLIVISNSVSSGAISGQTTTANGGAFGTPTGTGANGVVGSAGTVILLPN